ncbi:exodeoxyribonuclease V subunit gamma [Aestuariibacter salexigens]|uniref:exodeoxyribonuclease V subunit gamma n=1 Tax=Aestuariibacter salexigens TaxID=226010 RepID=UPI0004073DD0|nr:exodeoxyribonuclease V subunit gamma [Aestuariibacter salexigens]
MLSLYPSNRLEHLAVLLEAVLNQRQSSVLAADTILVESQGMQHWLNLHLANTQRIAMNMHYPMPTRFIWDCCRRLLGSDAIPQQSPYRREVMTWRIEQIFASQNFQRHPVAEPVNRYWQSGSDNDGDFKRYQLAVQLADLFEQYMLYRPDWLLGWEQSSELYFTELADEAWQSLVWRELVADMPDHPVRLMRRAMQVMHDNQHKLPSRVMVFAINTMAAQNVEFLAALSQYIDIHWFYLNPCVDYWGDLVTDRSRAKVLRQQQVSAYLSEQNNNRLLANLGQQGKDLFNLLNEQQTVDIAAFEAPWQADSKDKGSVLHSVQQDILSLSQPSHTEKCIDSSIQVVSCHTALREIQVLHDKLLHLLNADPSLKPSDVVVMCPAIEDYAPYVEAVFQTVGGDEREQTGPRLPCSVADRAPLDAEPVVNTFLELLRLPDSRFSVNALLETLRLPEVQKRFGIHSADLDTLHWWLQDAAVHWGLNDSHQASIVGVEQVSGMFSWEWGLNRLLTGMMHGDQTSMVGDTAILPHVEGQHAHLLGQLMQVLECMARHRQRMVAPRSVQEWQQYLLALRDDMFAQVDDEQGLALITQVIGDFAQTSAEASLEGTLTLSVVRDFLTRHLSKADAGNHFMTGQVTFCSMVPMRSIPFRVVAILGLNDGAFPRLDSVMSIDLMRQTSRRRGDRSRRGDDRYLFLEALISARDMLYLSYQGRHIKDNTERQPSLVLAELQRYLQQGYGWNFSPDASDSQLYQAPIHPFSADNYRGDSPSFDKGWYQTINPDIQAIPEISYIHPLEPEIDVDAMSRCFANPLKYYAQQVLGLYLDNDAELLDDNEPFDFSYLDRYQVVDRFTHAVLNNEDLDHLRYQVKQSGRMPDSPLSDQLLDDWQQTAQLLGDALAGTREVRRHVVSIAGHQLHSHIEWSERGPQLARPGKLRGQDKVALWLHHLIACMQDNGTVMSEYVYLHKEKDSTIPTVCRASIQPLSSDQAEEYLTDWLDTYRHCLGEPVLGVHAELAFVLYDNTARKCKDEQGALERMAQGWHKALYDENNWYALHHDRYFNWFYPQTLEPLPAVIEQLYKLYRPLAALIIEEKS